MNKILGIAAAILLVVALAAVWAFGDASRKQGQAETTATAATETVKTMDDDRKELEKIKYETDTLPDAGLDATLRDLGIMRRNEDR